MQIRNSALLALALAASTDAFAPAVTRSSSSALSALAGGLDLPDIEAEVRLRWLSLPLLCLSFESFADLLIFFVYS